MAAFHHEITYRSSDGLLLAARDYLPVEPSKALPAICLPGLTRNARDFHELALYLAREAPLPRRVIAFDYRGRGRSQHDPVWTNYNVVVEAGDIATGLAALGIAGGAFIGTSRGGLIVFALTAMKPSLLRAVVLNDIGPVIDTEGLAQIRDYLANVPPLHSFADAVAFQKQVHGNAFPALSEADVERGVRAFWREADGRLVPDMDPALVNTVTGLDLDKPLPALWPQFDSLSAIPLMAIRGENSKLLSEATLEAMAKRHPGMAVVRVAGQGHAPFLETGDLPQQISAFLEAAEHTG